MVKVIFQNTEGETILKTQGEQGESLLDLAHKNEIDMEGACEGAMACSTCHVIINPNWFSKLAPISEEEDDMLDLAFGLTKTSRLGCQIILNEGLDGIVVMVPLETRNMLS